MPTTTSIGPPAETATLTASIKKSESEIWFLPSVTLDNGIKLAVNIQLEGNTGGDQIDESFLQIKGAFAEVLLGSENSAGYKMTYAAPDVTFLNVNSGSLTFFVPFSGGSRGSDVFRRTLGTTYIENEGNNDSQRFTYFTPRFSGFQLGVSCARDGLQDTNVQIDEDVGQIANIFDIGANYVQSFGDFDVAVSGRWGTAETAGRADPDIWSAGFKVGGSYAEQNDAGLLNGESYDAGISYETGPWGFSATWFHGQNKGNGDGDEMFALNPANGKISEGTVAERGDEEIDQYLLGVKYVLAKGVVLNGFGAYVDFENAHGGISKEDVRGFVIGTTIRVDF